MKSITRRYLLVLLSILFLFNTAIPSNASSITYSNPNWECIYDNPTNAYSGAKKSWDISQQTSFSPPSWSSLNNPEYNVKLFGDINTPALKGDAVLLFIRIWQNLLVSKGYSPMQASSIKPDFKDFNNLVDYAQIETSILIDKGIISGAKEGDDIYLNFGNQLTRCELAVILEKFNILFWNFPKGENSGTCKDVNKNIGKFHWGEENIKYVLQYNLMTCDSNGNFNPDEIVTIPEVCEIALRLIGNTEITAKNLFEEMQYIFPIVSSAKFPDVKRTPIPVNSIRFTDSSSGFGYVNWGMVYLEVLPIEAAKYLDIRVIDHNLQTGVLKSLKIASISDKTKLGRLNTIGIELTALCPGPVTIEVRALDGSNKATTTETGPKPINYMQYSTEGKNINFNILGELETDVSKMPTNYMYYPYILKGIDNWIYEIPAKYYNLKTRSCFGSVIAWDKYSYAYTIMARELMKYYTTILNVDYETIDFQTFKDGLGNATEVFSDTDICNYIEHVKEHKIKTQGSIQLYIPIVYYWTDFHFRSQIKLDILSSDTNIGILLPGQRLNLMYGDTTFNFIADVPVSFYIKAIPLPALFSVIKMTDCNIGFNLD